jgi:DNA-binding LytR/AlgR family response regulator
MKPIPFFFWHGTELIKIDPEEIICLYTVKNYTRIYMTGERYHMLRLTLSSALKKLPPELFVKISRSIAASVFFIDQVGKYYVFIDGKRAPMSKEFYKPLLEKLKIIG